MGISRLLTDVKRWALCEDRIAAVILVGSYARGEARPDSDVDFVIITQHARSYVSAPQFTSQFGVCIRKSIEQYGKVVSIRACYQGGLEVEYGMAELDWASLPLDVGTRRVLEDGYIILADKQRVFDEVTRVISPRDPRHLK